MRSLTLGVVLLAIVTVAAQSSKVVISIEGRSRAVSATASPRASIQLVMAEPYSDGPWAAIPAQSSQDGSNLMPSFRIRAWTEGDKARVVVYGVVRETTSDLLANSSKALHAAFPFLNPDQLQSVAQELGQCVGDLSRIE